MRAVVFGLGRMGRRHVEVLQSMNYDVISACDPIAEARQIASETLGIAGERLYEDAKGLTSALDSADLAVIATTAPSHAELTALAAAAGVKFILCEKPMATSVQEAQAMIDVCEKSGARLAINHQMRVLPHYVWARERFGNATPQGPLASLAVAAGNFGLAMNGSHYFELFRYMTGEPVMSVQAWFDDDSVPNPRGTQFEDRSGCVRAMTASGKRLYMDFSADQGLGLRMTLSGRTGQLFIDELEGVFDEIVRQEEHRGRPTNQYALPWDVERGTVPPTDALASSHAVLEALVNEGDYPSGSDGLAVMRCLVACHLSHEQGGAVVHVSDTALAEDRVFPWA